jgi:hypothetical protein
MTTSNGEQEAARLERAVDAYIDRVAQVPPDLLEIAPAEGEWTIKELSAHSAEIYAYWASQLATLRQTPHQPFGRTMADTSRIAYVDTHKHDQLRYLISGIELGAAQAAAALRSFSPQEWASVTGIHSARGEMDMDAISNLFLAGHAEEHLEQLDTTLEQVRAKASGPQAPR